MLVASRVLTSGFFTGIRIGLIWSAGFSAFLWNLSERDISYFEFLSVLAPLGCGLFVAAAIAWEFSQNLLDSSKACQVGESKAWR